MKKLTQEKFAYIWSYNHARYKSLYEAYERPSKTKQEIEEEILAEMREREGYDFRITGRSSNFFSCGFRFMKDGLEYLMYFKPTKWYIEIPLQYVEEETGEILNITNDYN